MSTKIKRIVAVLNSFDLAPTILEKTLSFAKRYDSIVEVIYIHEKPLFDIPDFFISAEKRGDDLLDKDRVKDEIKNLILSLEHKEDIATFVYINDTEDRVANLIKDDKDSLIITAYHEKITNKLLKKVANPTLVLKNQSKIYNNIAICINASSDVKECINSAKYLYSECTISLLYDYKFIVDPSMELDLQNIADIEKLQRDQFSDIKKRNNLDGEFFVDGSFLADNLINHIKEKDFDLVIDCLDDGSLLAKEISNDIFFTGENMNKYKEKLEKLSDMLSNSKEISQEEKAQAVKHIQEWYEEDRGMDLLAEQLASISSKITPILREIGL